MVRVMNIVLILDNIRSAHNVGSIFRTADGAGVTKIFISGVTPAPSDRFGRPVKEIAKVALGAEKAVAWQKTENTTQIISKLKKEGYSVVALEQDERAVDYKNFKPSGKIALIVGNEVGGISKDILKLCDHVIEIPMKGKKESLNVSVATGIALFQIFGQ